MRIAFDRYIPNHFLSFHDKKEAIEAIASKVEHGTETLRKKIQCSNSLSATHIKDERSIAIMQQKDAIKVRFIVSRFVNRFLKN